MAAAAGLNLGLHWISVSLITPIAFFGGFLARDWWLGKETERRRASLQDELPTAIDLLILSLMAGESIPASLDRVAQTMRSGIGDEFAIVTAEVRSGISIAEALEGLKLRLPLSGVTRLVDALTTSLERGSPLADVLLAQADDGREARRRTLLELGGKREVVMLLPVVFLIMPVVVLVALLPGLVSLDLLVP
ncbi:MAG: type II secretion system F family protein [Actinomycetota bacterium]|nr:type II secretion system F family protein [Actinomycetota bacterium]